MRCQAATRGLAWALLVGLAAGLRPTRGGAAHSGPAWPSSPSEVITRVVLPQTPAVRGTRASAGPRLLDDEVAQRTLAQDALAVHGHDSLYAFPQTLEGVDLRRWLIRATFQKRTLWWIIIVETVILLFTLGGPLLLWWGTRLLGNTIKAGIETFDMKVLGVDVEIERIHPDLLYGILDIEGLLVKNPAGKGYDSEHLLKAKRAHIDIDMLRLFCSFFRHVEIEKVVFKDVDVIYEKHWNTSNIQDVLSFLSSGQQARRDGAKSIEEGTSPTSKSRTPPDSPSQAVIAPPPRAASEPAGLSSSPRALSKLPSTRTAKAEARDKTVVSLHEVHIEDVGARAQAKMLGGRGFRISVSDIYYKDFAKDVGKVGVGDVVRVLLKSLLKTVLANIIGKKFGDQCM